VSGFELRLAPGAERPLQRLPQPVATAIAEFITGPLLEAPFLLGKPLLRELAGYRSARRGDYRVAYRVEEEAETVRVVRIDHRADIYRPR